VVADVTGDGTDDVLVVDGAGNILYRQGTPGQPGSFEPPITINPGFPSRDIAWLPKTDQGPVLASLDAHDDAISFYAYRDGRFVRLIGSLRTGRLPAQILAAQLNGDGLEDLVVRNAGDGTVSVYRAAFAPASPFVGPLSALDPPSFLPAEIIPLGLGVSDVQAVDTSGDGSLDLVITNKLTGQVSVLHNFGNGFFAAPVPYRAGTGLSAVDPGGTPEVTSLEATAGVAAGPLTTGGPTDLVTINPGSNTMDVLAGLGGGRFANPLTIETPSPARVVRVADFTGNGIPDLAVLTAKGVSIYLGNGKGGFAPPVTYDAGPEPSGLTVADVNRDGNPDLLIGNSYGDVLVLLGHGDGTFQTYHEANQAIELAVADLTGKGSKDIIYADQGLDRVVVDYGAGNSTVLANQATGLLDPGAVKLADLNGDGIPDLIVANSGSNNVLIYPGLGNGQFGPAVNGGHGYFVGTNPVGITAADLTGSGLPDLVVADEGSNQVSILLNQGNFRFTQGPRLNSGGTGPVSTVVGHFSSGAFPDLLVTKRGSNNVALLPGVGGGFFNDTKPQTFAVGDNPGPLLVGTFDGKPDLVTVNAGSNDLTLVSGFMGADPVTTAIASGGTDPVTAFSFSSDSGFDNLVVGNGGDGVLALFEGSDQGLALTSSAIEADLPSPTALAFSALSGGEVQFYAATAGVEAAALVELSLASSAPGAPPPPIPVPPTPTPTSPVAAPPVGLQEPSEAAPLPGPVAPETPVVAQLVPLQASSLALVGTLLITTLPSSGNAANLGTTETEATSAVAAAVAPASGTPAASVGQGVLPLGGNGATAGGDQEPDTQQAAPAPVAQAPPGATPWQRFVLGTDEALERFDHEHPGPSTQERHDAPQAYPAGGQGDIEAPARQEPPTAEGTPARAGGRLEAIDGAIERWHDPVPVPPEGCIRRVGGTHQKPNCMRIGLVGSTHPTIRPEPGHEGRPDLSAALALAATVAGEFYFSTADRRARVGRRIANACGRLGPRVDLDHERGNSFQDPRSSGSPLEHSR
jgi:hypothetical protein